MSTVSRKHRIQRHQFINCRLPELNLNNTGIRSLNSFPSRRVGDEVPGVVAVLCKCMGGSTSAE